MNYAEYQERKSRLTDEQVEAIKAKCRWEGCPWVGIATDWPSMFDVPGMPPATPYVPQSRQVGPEETLASDIGGELMGVVNDEKQAA